jgi:hypothetical protein
MQQLEVIAPGTRSVSLRAPERYQTGRPQRVAARGFQRSRRCTSPTTEDLALAKLDRVILVDLENLIDQARSPNVGTCRHPCVSHLSVRIRGADVTWIFDAGAHRCGFTLLKRVVVTYCWASPIQRTVLMCLRPTILSLGFGLHDCDNTQRQCGRRDNESHSHHLYRSSRPYPHMPRAGSTA